MGTLEDFRLSREVMDMEENHDPKWESLPMVPIIRLYSLLQFQELVLIGLQVYIIPLSL